MGARSRSVEPKRSFKHRVKSLKIKDDLQSLKTKQLLCMDCTCTGHRQRCLQMPAYIENLRYRTKIETQL